MKRQRVVLTPKSDGVFNRHGKVGCAICFVFRNLREKERERDRERGEREIEISEKMTVGAYCCFLMIAALVHTYKTHRSDLRSVRMAVVLFFLLGQFLSSE